MHVNKGLSYTLAITPPYTAVNLMHDVYSLATFNSNHKHKMVHGSPRRIENRLSIEKHPLLSNLSPIERRFEVVGTKLTDIINENNMGIR